VGNEDDEEDKGEERTPKHKKQQKKPKDSQAPKAPKAKKPPHQAEDDEDQESEEECEEDLTEAADDSDSEDACANALELISIFRGASSSSSPSRPAPCATPWWSVEHKKALRYENGAVKAADNYETDKHDMVLAIFGKEKIQMPILYKDIWPDKANEDATDNDKPRTKRNELKQFTDMGYPFKTEGPNNVTVERKVTYQRDRYIGQLVKDNKALVQVTDADVDRFKKKLKALKECEKWFLKSKCNLTKAELTKVKDDVLSQDN